MPIPVAKGLSSAAVTIAFMDTVSEKGTKPCGGRARWLNRNRGNDSSDLHPLPDGRHLWSVRYREGRVRSSMRDVSSLVCAEAHCGRYPRSKSKHRSVAPRKHAPIGNVKRGFQRMHQNCASESPADFAANLHSSVIEEISGERISLASRGMEICFIAGDRDAPIVSQRRAGCVRRSCNLAPGSRGAPLLPYRAQQKTPCGKRRLPTGHVAVGFSCGRSVDADDIGRDKGSSRQPQLAEPCKVRRRRRFDLRAAVARASAGIRCPEARQSCI